jgi:cob(I)alamin adenosyltransferase
MRQGVLSCIGKLRPLAPTETILPRIYTRTGDDGTTGLIGGKRVTKDSPRIEACGSLDELNAAIGVVRSWSLPDDVDRILHLVQEALFKIGSELASPEDSGRGNPGLEEREVRNLESEIDAFESGLTPLRDFILPGGTGEGAQMHLVRALARKAERRCVSLSRVENLNPRILRYLNRLSDLCFVLARFVNHQQSVPEEQPSFGKTHE